MSIHAYNAYKTCELTCFCMYMQQHVFVYAFMYSFEIEFDSWRFNASIRLVIFDISNIFPFYIDIMYWNFHLDNVLTFYLDIIYWLKKKKNKIKYFIVSLSLIHSRSWIHSKLNSYIDPPYTLFFLYPASSM